MHLTKRNHMQAQAIDILKAIDLLQKSSPGSQNVVGHYSVMPGSNTKSLQCPPFVESWTASKPRSCVSSLWPLQKCMEGNEIADLTVRLGTDCRAVKPAPLRLSAPLSSRTCSSVKAERAVKPSSVKACQT